ncbi:hypothetical protein [Kitasatospora viridis]|uniref:DUF2846 domain-containing protein n=1 Tax=Kitasatospora viridis TaxID=281105 RepID=A0A561TTW8_9ACTN|nr:hypothetical protein [Kitasatospora viridis]TWF90556.1 hypothetical protein FHX73_13603 [Kitasatospora viridis]
MDAQNRSADGARTPGGSGGAGRPVPPPSSVIVLARAVGGSRDRYRRYQVLMDGQPAGTIGHGETRRFEVPPGAHRLQLAVGQCTSRTLASATAPGEVSCYVCGPSRRLARNVFATVADLTTRRNDYIALERTAEPVVASRAARTADRAANWRNGAVLAMVAGLLWTKTGVAATAGGVLLLLGAAVGGVAVFVEWVVARETPNHRGW